MLIFTHHKSLLLGLQYAPHVINPTTYNTLYQQGGYELSENAMFVGDSEEFRVFYREHFKKIKRQKGYRGQLLFHSDINLKPGDKVYLLGPRLRLLTVHSNAQVPVVPSDFRACDTPSECVPEARVSGNADGV